MLVQSLNPEILTPSELDLYLEAGWFRMGNAIFTTNFLKFHDVFYSAIWLRIDLEKFKPSKTQLKLKKLNARFRTEIIPADFKIEQDVLFQKYRSSISFDASPSNRDILGHTATGIYNTHEINIYDDQKLIATGYFDIGNETSAGITCFYDPDYKQFSLGKYLMFLKMEFSQQQGFRYFYPGYFAPNYPLFNYKLDIAKPYLEFFNLTTNLWHVFAEFDDQQVPLDMMVSQLTELSTILTAQNFEHQLFYYDFYDADLMASLNGQQLFDFPVFIQCFNKDTSIAMAVIVYDPRDHQFHLLQCMNIYNVDSLKKAEDRFNRSIIQTNQHLFASIFAERMAYVVMNSLKKTIDFQGF